MIDPEPLLVAESGAESFSDALDFAVAKPTWLLLVHAGAINSSSPLPTSQNSQPAYSTLEWRPLIPSPDLAILLAAVPPKLRPTDLPFAISEPQSSPQARQQLLDTVARLALEPPLTLEVMRRFRPINPHLWGRWLEMLGLDAAGEWRAQDSIEVDGERNAVEKVFTAMVSILPVFENVFP